VPVGQPVAEHVAPERTPPAAQLVQVEARPRQVAQDDWHGTHVVPLANVPAGQAE